MKTILITGATSGIGKATAIHFASTHLYQLILCGRRMERLTQLKRELEDQYHIPILLLNFDIRHFEACSQAIASIPNPFENIDILINNAGLALGLDSIQDGNISHWDTMIDTNVKGLLYMTKLISKKMVKSQSGHIINICSTAGKEVYPKGNVYCATKFAVDTLTKAIRQDLYTHNIRVSQVSPGHVEETEFAINRFEGDKNKAAIYNDFIPLKAADVAASIYFIASQPAHINIQDIVMMSTQQGSATLVNRNGRNGQ